MRTFGGCVSSQFYFVVVVMELGFCRTWGSVIAGELELTSSVARVLSAIVAVFFFFFLCRMKKVRNWRDQI